MIRSFVHLISPLGADLRPAASSAADQEPNKRATVVAPGLSSVGFAQSLTVGGSPRLWASRCSCSITVVFDQPASSPAASRAAAHVPKAWNTIWRVGRFSPALVQSPEVGVRPREAASA